MWAFLYDDALPDTLFERLTANVVEHLDVLSTYEHSLWFGREAAPQLYIEHAIALVARLVPTTSAIAGAEWWIVARKSSLGMEWHCDCDRIIYSREKRFVRPAISSVLYLNDSGGPTLIVDDVASNASVRRPTTERGCLGFLPNSNRYGVFPGDRFHAVAITDDDDDRITIAINWWAEKPSAPLCIDPPLELSALLTAPPDSHFFPTAARPVGPVQLNADEMARLRHVAFRPVYRECSR